MHYRGMLRIARRDSGTRIYAVREASPDPPDAPMAAERFDRLLDVAVRKYAPLPAASLGQLASLMSGGAPQWRSERAAALARAKARLAHSRLDGVDWYWPATESPRAARYQPEGVRLLTPFDPVVWDRRRFEMFWGWRYRFEAYTPVHKRKLGYYALPLLVRERVIGWANVTFTKGVLTCSFGYADGKPSLDRRFRDDLDAELSRLTAFLRLP
jgi:uncharacterized protein YcaQ